MNATEFAAIGERLFGPRWHTALARTLGVSVRTVQRCAAGTHPVPDGLAHDLRVLDAHDEWIAGDGAVTMNEYLVHTKWPRFIARVVAEDDPHDAGAPLSPLVLALDDVTTLRQIIWIDPPPDHDGMQAILRGAYDALADLS